MAKSDKFTQDLLGEAVCSTTGRIIPIKGGIKRTPAQRKIAKQRFDACSEWLRTRDDQLMIDVGLFPSK